MSPAETVHAFLVAMEKMNYDAAMQFVSEDITYTNGASDAVKGHEGILNTLVPFFTPLKENDFQILREAANGNTVFLERLDRHLADHGWFELPVNSVFEVEDGKLVYWREYFDAALIQKDIMKMMGAAT